MKNFVIALSTLFLLFCNSCTQNKRQICETKNNKNDYYNSPNFIPNEETAINVAEAIWIPIYGKDYIIKHRPYYATLKDGTVWVVSSEAQTTKGKSFFALIKKSNGEVLKTVNITKNYLKFKGSNSTKDGYIPNEETAVSVAETILIPIYGKDDLLKYRPYHAILKDGTVWVVKGDIHIGKGGSSFVLIKKSSGKILKAGHEE